METMEKYKELNLNYIDGQWRKGNSKEVVESFDPYTEESYVKVQAASLEDLNEAYESAKNHQKEWAKSNPFTRAGIIRKAIDIMENRKEELVDILVKDAG